MIDFETRNKLIKEIPELLRCFQCGTCVSSCPAEKYGKSYSPRRKILAALYGNKEILSKELWRCLTCNSCNERCPQDVNPYDVLVKLKNFSYKNKLVDESLSNASKNVIETGKSIPYTERSQQQRKSLSLEEIRIIEELKKLI